MSRIPFFSRLDVQLLCSAAAAFAVGALLYMFLSMGAYRLVESRLFSQEARKELSDDCYERLQEYISDFGLRASEAWELDGWTRQENGLLITVYEGEQVIYQNADITVGRDFPRAFSYGLQFADGEAEAMILCAPGIASYLAADFTCGFLAIIGALFILYLCIRRKVRYIGLLESELQVLKGGNLDYPVTVKGRDELASLAAEMDNMRRAIRDRQAREEQAVKANRDLVTAMSHDLRTPLTSLLGYTDILSLSAGENSRLSAGQRQYIQAIRDKARRIKELSDQLFEYFLVFGKEKEDLDFQRVNGIEFLGQVVEESLFDMESEGFFIERSSDEISCSLLVDIPSVRRVFGNIFSNLSKYADRSSPVQVSYRQTENCLTISFRNRAAGSAMKTESSGIGLKTCKRIMEAHGGEFRCVVENGMFETELTFPVA